MPVLFLEENYEDENNVGEIGTPNVLRRQEYWSLTAGALAGHMYGSYWTDRFDPAWQPHLSSQSVTELGYFKNFFTALIFKPWFLTRITLCLTAGYGTYNDNNVHVSQDDYATAAKVFGRFSGYNLYACLAHDNGCDGKLRRSGDREMVRPDQRHFPDDYRLAIPEQRQPQFHYTGKQQRGRSRLGFALAGSIRFANADSNSYRSYGDTYSDSQAPPTTQHLTLQHLQQHLPPHRNAYPDT